MQRTIEAIFVLLLIGLVGTFCPVPSANAQDISELFGDADDSADTEPASLLDVLKRDSLLTKLQLNNDQRTKIRAIIEGHAKQEEELQKSYDERKKSAGLQQRAALLKELRGKTTEIRTQAEKSLSALLSPAQKESLAKELPAAGQEQDPESTSDVKPASPSAKSARPRRSGRTTYTPRSVGRSGNDSGNTVASFAARADEKSGELSAGGNTADSNASGQLTGSKNGVAAPEPTDTELLSFSFENAPWTDVLKLFVGAAKLNLNMRDKPLGVFSYYDQQSYTPSEALDIMNRYLMQDGFILIRHDRFLTVLDVKKGIPPNLIQTVSLEELPKRGKTELLRISLPLGDRDANKAAEEIRVLLGPQGTVAPLESANSVVITDIASNLMRVQELLEPPPKVGATEQTFQAFPLTNIDANDAADIVRDLFGLKSGVENVSESQSGRSSSSNSSSRGRFDPRAFFSRMSSGGSSSSRDRGRDSSRSSSSDQSESSSAKKVTVAVDQRTNSVLVRATAAEMKLVAEIIEALDVDSTDSERSFEATRRSKEPYLEVYQLKTANATETAKTLGVLHPGLVVNEDGHSKRIHIWATAKEHQVIATHIRQLDGEVVNQLLVMIELDGRSAFNTSTMLTAMFAEGGGTPPTIQSDPTGRNLIVNGSVNQIQQIRSLVAQLPEDGAVDSRQAVRVIGVGSGSSAFVQQTITALYPQVTISSTGISSDQSSNGSSRNSSSSRRGSTRASNDADRERSERIQRYMEMRSRFFGGGSGGRPDFGRGGSSRSGGRPDSGSRSRDSRGGSSSSRGSFSRGGFSRGSR